MRLFVWFSVAAVNAAAIAPSSAVTRPQYGGTLRIEMRAAVASLDAAVVNNSAAARRLAALVFEPLPALVVSARHDADFRRWELQLRPGVRFHDGAALTAGAMASILAPLLPDTAVSVSNEHVLLQSARPLASVPPVMIRAPGKPGSGTGPFRLTLWEAGRRAVFTANDDYWGGRPFVDTIEVAMNRPYRDGFIDLELGNADIVDLEPGQLRRASEGGRQIWSSEPVQLMALLFGRGKAAADRRLREAVALAIDRNAIYNVLLQRQGVVSGGLLPGWLSGYAFLFPAAPDLARARELVSRLPAAQRSLTFGYDASNALARAVAERIALNAHDAGLTLQVVPGASPQLRLVETRVASLDPAAALAQLAASLGLIARMPDLQPQAIYEAESALLEERQVVPLFHLPDLYGVNPRVRTWLATGVGPLGFWHAADAWIAGPAR